MDPLTSGIFPKNAKNAPLAADIPRLVWSFVKGPSAGITPIPSPPSISGLPDCQLPRSGTLVEIWLRIKSFWSDRFDLMMRSN
jgi:hypothetical protein